MIRAVYSHGLIVPVDGFPADWEEGQALRVEPDTNWENPSRDDLHQWFDELQALGATEYEPGEKERMQAVMAEADRQAKEFVRREMGLQ